MKLMTIATIIFDTLKGTNKGLLDLLKIAMVVYDALKEEGIIEKSRNMEHSELDAESQNLVRRTLDAIHTEM